MKIVLLEEAQRRVEAEDTWWRENRDVKGLYTSGATDFKLDNALAVTPDGVPVGVAAQVWWSRPRKRAKKKATFVQGGRRNRPQPGDLFPEHVDRGKAPVVGSSMGIRELGQTR